MASTLLTTTPWPCMRLPGHTSRSPCKRGAHMGETTPPSQPFLPPKQLEVIVHEPTAGEPTRPTVLFVHGSCHQAACWCGFQTHFAHAGYRSLAFSLRGHGQSGGREDVLHNRLQDYVADLESVVRGLHGRPFILVGHSLGGYVVQSYL